MIVNQNVVSSGGKGYYITDATVEAQLINYPKGAIEPGSLVTFEYNWYGYAGNQADFISVEGYDYKIVPTEYSTGMVEPGLFHYAFYMPAANVAIGDRRG